MKQREQKPNSFGLCRVATEEGEANAAWGGQWDAKVIMISMGAHATTEDLNNCPDFTVAFATKQTMVAADFVGIVSAKNDADKMAKTGWKCEKSENVNAPVFTDFPMTLECRIKEKIDESEEGYYIVAEIVNILVDENYLAEDGKPDTERPSLISLAVTATFIWKVANPLYIDVRLVAHGQIHQPEKVNQGTEMNPQSWTQHLLFICE